MDGMSRWQRSVSNSVAAAGAAATLLCTSATAHALPLPSRTVAKAASLTVPVAMFGGDDRQIMKGRADLSSRLGLLRHRTTGGYCTAFCIAPHVIATAGHCVLGTRPGQRLDPAGFRFTRDDRRKSTPVRIAGWRTRSEELNILTGADRLRTRPPINASADWALLRLDQKACPEHNFAISSADNLEIAERAAKGDLFHVSYHRDIPGWRLALSRNCSIARHPHGATRRQIADDFDDVENLLLHTCDTDAASSGSPLLAMGAGGPEIIGINVGTYVRSRVITHDGEVVQRMSSETIANTALVAAPLAEYVRAFVSAEAASSAGEIERLQALLAQRGFFSGDLDGRFGPLTRAAISSFEAQSGLIVTGLPTRQLLERLKASSVEAGH